MVWKPLATAINLLLFLNIEDAKEYKNEYRASLDALELDQSQIDAIISEANYAFKLNMNMFDEIQGSASKSFLRLALSYLGSFVQEMTVSKRYRWCGML